MGEGKEALWDHNTNCLFLKETNGLNCQCKAGYEGSGSHGDFRDLCDDYCYKEGVCLNLLNSFNKFQLVLTSLDQFQSI